MGVWAQDYVPKGGVDEARQHNNINAGVRFGPLVGAAFNAFDKAPGRTEFIWKIFDENNRVVKVIDQTDKSRSNWMRYVNPSNRPGAQNLIAAQVLFTLIHSSE